MNKNSDKTVHIDKLDNQSRRDKEFGYSTTTELPRKAVIEEIPIKRRSHLKITGFGGKDKVIELGEGQVIIGRSPECRAQLPVNNVSRKHARVIFRNEEYHIEDLGSVNGTYVNGIRIVKCVLRNNDQIDIGEVKILFYEEETLQKA